jgi:hypothetical protein
MPPVPQFGVLPFSYKSIEAGDVVATPVQVARIQGAIEAVVRWLDVQPERSGDHRLVARGV